MHLKREVLVGRLFRAWVPRWHSLTPRLPWGHLPSLPVGRLCDSVRDEGTALLFASVYRSWSKWALSGLFIHVLTLLQLGVSIPVAILAHVHR